MDGYVSKPIRPDTLISELERLVPGRVDQQTERATVPTVALAIRDVEATDALDRKALLDRVEGDVELLGEMIELFKEDSVRLLATIRDGLDTKKPDVVRHAAHTLKGTCGNLGASQAAATAAELEKLAAAGNISGGQDIFRSLEEQVQRAGKLLDGLKQECLS